MKTACWPVGDVGGEDQVAGGVVCRRSAGSSECDSQREFTPTRQDAKIPSRMASPTTSDLAEVILKPRRARPFFGRHPWVFAGAVHRVLGRLEAGTEVVVRSDKGQFIARGLANPDSQILVRLYSWDEQRPLDDTFWAERLEAAVALRRRLYGQLDGRNACRLVFSEGDGLSGLIVDWYAGWLVVQFTSKALYGRHQVFIDWLKRKLSPAGIHLRTERGMREAEGLELSDHTIAGDKPPRPLFIEEHGVQFGVDIVEGQKTGFYLDQRENRRSVAAYLQGDRVLDLFCYSGGFGITALRLGGAKRVLGIDSSESALRLARANAALNDVADRAEFQKDQVVRAVQRLKAAGERFDAVILDPPKMARQRSGAQKALRAYQHLNRLAVDLLASPGRLITCSCSGLISREDFESMLAVVSEQSRRPLRILEQRGQAPDHPVSASCRETAYLKCAVCYVE